MNLTALLTALALVALTSGAPSEDRIYNGVASTTAIPYLVSIVANEQHICGGWIYNTNWVVTVASCLVDYEPSQLTVIVAQTSLIQLDADEESINVFKIISHEAYNPVTKLNDIAMLQLAKPITYGANVGYLPYEEAEEVAGIPTTFAGWGGTSEGNLPSTKLRTIASVTVPADCTISYPADEFSSNYMLCAGSTTDTASPCHFDEGSPLVQTIGGAQYAVGIMSKNKGCKAGAEPTVYTRLTAYYAWLKSYGGNQQ
ncbi:trypsin-1-like [Daphnia pulex]|uniref:trypsin-1-like n=1 Tax=Daphnia pulex TaxID=6669 RepID=UPI001EDE9E23|nr:trypsin-1-like [Daphnia pulex]